MDQTTVIQIIILIALLALSAFFSSAETAFISANRIRMRSLAEEGNAKAPLVLEIMDHSEKTLSAILIGNNIVNLSASSLATSLSIRLIGSLGAGIATFILTFLVLIFGEISPKTMAQAHAEKLALRYVNHIRFWTKLLTPVIFIINLLSRGVLFLFGYRKKENTPEITEGDLKTIVDVSHEDGVIESDERNMIFNLFHFSDALAKEIMIPRIDMISICVDDSYEDLMNLYREHMLTRFPVYEDANDNIIGFINMKDVLLLTPDETFSLRSIMRTPYYTHERKNTAELLVEMRSAQVNIAIVLDEYGVCAGMITMEDLLEEIVGEIRDEYDTDEEDPIRPISENSYLIDGVTNIDDINEALGTWFSSEDYDSMGGYVLGVMERLPNVGDVFTTEDGVYLRVESMQNNRIDKVYVELPQKEEESASEA